MTTIKTKLAKDWLADKLVIQDSISKKFIASAKKGGELTDDPKLARLYANAEAYDPHLSYLDNEYGGKTKFQYVLAKDVADFDAILGTDKED